MKLRVIVAGGDPSFQKTMVSHLERLSADLDHAVRPADVALTAVRAGEADLVFCGATDSEKDTLDRIQAFREASPHVELVLVARKPSLEFAMEAIRRGASDCLAQPVRREQVELAVDRVRRVKGLLDENRRLREQIERREHTDGLLGSSQAIMRVFKMVEEASAEDAGVLIFGEPGTERTYVAKLIHSQGRRGGKPFVAVDCATPARDTLESAAIAEAAGGTLHLDNIEELPGRLQDAVVQAMKAADGVRIIAATTKNLLDIVGRGLFRRATLDAISSATITIPPLRERREDLPLLINALLKRLSPADRVVEISPQAMDALSDYDWPGNAEELERVVQRAIDLSTGGMIGRDDLPPSVIQGAESKGKAGTESGTVATKSLKELESDIIQQLLVEQKGDTAKVSELLKIDRSTLYRKIKRYGIDLDNLKG